LARWADMNDLAASLNPRRADEGNLTILGGLIVSVTLAVAVGVGVGHVTVVLVVRLPAFLEAGKA